MKIFKDRTVQFNPFGQIIEYEDGTTEFDIHCQQTTPILTAQQYNGKAAKNDDGEWVPAPGARVHEIEKTLLGFEVGLTYVGTSTAGRAEYDYTVITPTGVAFHGDGKHNVVSVPSSWQWMRVAAEAIMWICVGEDAGIIFPDHTTTEQWLWIRSYDREEASAAIDDWIEVYNRADSRQAVEAYTANLVESRMNTVGVYPSSNRVWVEAPDEPESQPPTDADKIATLVDRYGEYILANQTSLVIHILNQNDGYVTLEDNAVNFYPKPDMLASDAASYIADVLGEDWRDLIQDEYLDDDDNSIDPADLTPDDLTVDDVAILQEYVVDNGEAAEVYEWWLVNDWLADQMGEIGECILTDGSNYWWGRTCTGQMIKMDGTLQKIAAKYIEYV